MFEERVIKFLEDFHRSPNFESRLHVLGSFLSSFGIYSCCLILNTKIKQYFKLTDDDLSLSIKNQEHILSNNEAEIVLCQDNKMFNTLALPLNENESVYGWLVFTPKNLDFSIKRIIKSELTCYLKQIILNQTYLKKAHQLETICILSEKVSTFFDLKHLLDVVTKYVTEALNAQGAVIRLVNKQNNLLEIMSEYGLQNVDIRRYGIEIGSGISGEVWQNRKPKLVLPDTEESKQLLSSKLQIKSLICVPLIFENGVIGTLSVYEKLSEKPFDDEDKVFLEVISGFVAPFIAYTSALEREQELFKQIKKNLENFEIITELNKIIMLPRKIDELLFLILTALTFGKDIGFNRAGLFMYNAQTGTLQGMIGVGCEREEETQIWERLPKDMTTIQWLETIEKKGLKNESSFNDKIKTIRFDISDFPIIIQILRKGIVYVSNKDVSDIIKKQLGVEEYAIVPLLGKEDLLGMLYVDNKFNKKPIDESYIRLLQIFASQAALAIENAKLYHEITTTNDLLKTAKQELLVKEKLATVGEMLTTLAHEIRNPLTAMGGFANIIAKKTDNAMIKDLAEKIFQHATRMDNMFKEFILLAKYNSFNIVQNDLNEILKSCVDFFRFHEQSGIKFILELSPVNIIFPVDRSMIEVVINNLLKNAIQAMPEGGNIVIKSYMENGFAVFSIEDDGHGIPSEVLPNIFDPFYTTKFNGFGIGLSISYKIIKHHNGIIYAENKEGGGAKFVVKLPMFKPQEG